MSYKIVSDENRLTAARLLYDENLIELGCNMSVINKDIHTDRVWPFFNQFQNMEEYYEKCIEGILNHEILHKTIYFLSGINTSFSFDNIDNNHEISIVVGGKQ